MRVLMIGPDQSVKGGISSVVNGYFKSVLVTDHHIEYLSTHFDECSKFQKLLYAIRAVFKLIGKLIFKRPDIAHVHSSFGASFYRKSFIILILKLFKVKTINHIHGADFDEFYLQASPKKKKMVKYIYNLVDANIVLSQEWYQRLVPFVEKTKIIVIHNFAVCPTHIPDYDKRKMQVLFLGEIGVRKGAFDLPDIINRVVDQVPSVKFVIAGNGDINKVKGLFKNKEVLNHVEFPGWIGSKDKKSLLKDSRVYILPSYNEGLPMSILEAMSYGIPIVSTKVGGIPQLVTKECGLLTEAGDKESFAKGIIKILKNSDLALNMSIYNRELIRREFDKDFIGNQVSQLYRSLTGKE